MAIATSHLLSKIGDNRMIVWVVRSRNRQAWLIASVQLTIGTNLGFSVALLCQNGKTQSLKGFQNFTFQLLAINFSFY